MKGEQPPSWFRVWIIAARPKTLFAAIAPVVLGVLLALDAGLFHGPSAFTALMCAVLIQIGTNFSNDAEDFVRGADAETRKGPTRAVAAGYVTPREMRIAAAMTFGVAFVLGLSLVWRGGWAVLAVGVASILSGMAYTYGRYALAYTGLADLFVLIFFGPVAVAGTFYVQALELPLWVILAGLGPGFLATAVLVANNVRDVQEDRVARKRTLVVRFGRAVGVRLYGACISGALAVPAAFVLYTRDHVGALAACLLVSLVGRRLTRTLSVTRDPAVLNTLLGKTALLLFGYSVLFGVGWLLT